MTTRIFILFLSCILYFGVHASCTQKNTNNNYPNSVIDYPTKRNGSGTDTYLFDSIQRDVSNGYWRFSVDLIDKVRTTTKDNVIISPLSLSMLLSLIANGASDQVCAEILSVLGTTSLEELNMINHHLIEKWNINRSSATLNIANSIWTDNEIVVSSGFNQVARNIYNTSCFRTALSSISAMNQINNWVEEKTKGLIPILLSQPLPPASDVMAINTAYFKGIWDIPFEKEDSKEEIFYSQNGTTNKVMTMHNWDDFLYLYSEKYHAVKLNYKNKDFHMIVYMPRDEYTLEDLSQALVNGDSYSRIFKEVILSLPRFKIEYENRDYRSLLNKMGITKLFTDASAMTKMTNRPTLISGIMQKSFVSVDEEGTEAAAASATIYQTAANPLTMPEPIRFTVDRPFLFMIRESSSGCVLFAGIIRNL